MEIAYYETVDEDSLSFSESLDLKEKTGDELLIQLVQSYPVIYNKNLPEHKDNNIVKNAWKEIAEAMGLTVAECEARFTRLKQYYARERAKRDLETRSGCGSTSRKTWELFEAMTFLEIHIVRRKGLASKLPGKNINKNCNSSLMKTTVSAKQYDDNKENSGIGYKINLICETPSTSSDHGITDDDVLAEEQTPRKKLKFIEPKRMKKVDPLEQSFYKMNSAIETIVHNYQMSSNEPEDHFGKLVASELKKKSPEIKEKLKKQIMELLYFK